MVAPSLKQVTSLGHCWRRKKPAGHPETLSLVGNGAEGKGGPNANRSGVPVLNVLVSSISVHESRLTLLSKTLPECIAEALGQGLGVPGPSTMPGTS